MNYADTITLVTQEGGRTKDGYLDTKPETLIDVYADVLSVKRQEFYQALRSGIDATVVFKVFRGDYDGQKYIDYDNCRYRVIRTFTTGDRIEITCKKDKTYADTDNE